MKYGSYQITFIPGAGGLIGPAGPTPSSGARLPPPPLVAVSTPLGRGTMIAAAVQALAAGRRAAFHGPCGIGKTTLLRHLALEAGRKFGAPGVYLEVAADDEPAALVQRLARLVGQPAGNVRPTSDECARILATARPVVALDLESWPADRLGSALDLLHDCHVVLGSEQPCAVPSWRLTGLEAADALTLIERDLGRALNPHEIAPARRLVTATEGHPLRLRRAAALARTGHRWEALAERSPESLARLSHGGLSRVDRRVLGALVAVGGGFLSSDLVDVISDAGKVQQTLESLRGRRLVEVHGDRFGLPDCRLGGDRDFYLRMLDVGSASRQIVTWLGQQDPTAADTLDMAAGAVKLIKIAAERKQWHEVVTLLEVVDPVLTLAGRWQTCEKLLDLGIGAAQHVGDLRAEALFNHDLGTLNLCEGRVDEARQHLTEALQLRRRLGDNRAADVSQHNLQMLLPMTPPPARPGSPRSQSASLRRRLIGALSALVAILIFIIGVVDAARGGRNDVALPTPSSPPSPATPPATPTPTPPVTREPETPTATETTTPPGPPLTLTPASIAFPDQQVGPRFARRSERPATRTLTLTNHSGGSIGLDRVLSDTEAFRVDAAGCDTIAAGASCAVAVSFAPSAIGSFSGILTVSPNGSPKLKAKASGTGFAVLKIELGDAAPAAVTDDTGTVSCTPNSCPDTLLNRADQRELTLTADACDVCAPVWEGCEELPGRRCRLTMDRVRTVKVNARDPDPDVE